MARRLRRRSRRGDGCPMCGGGADETPHGLRVFAGAWGGRLPRPPPRAARLRLSSSGTAATSRSPPSSSPEEAAGFWSDVARVAGRVEEEYQPAKMNWLSLGNGVPHLHVHLVPRPHDDARAGLPLETEAFWRGRHAGHRAGRSWRGRLPALRARLCALTMRDRLAEGRTAEVFAHGEGTVLKLGLTAGSASRPLGAPRRGIRRRGWPSGSSRWLPGRCGVRLTPCCGQAAGLSSPSESGRSRDTSSMAR